MQQQCECKIEGNMNIQIIGICLNEECSEEWFCQNCIGNHDNHKNDLKIGDQMDQLLEKYNSANNQKFIEADEKFQKLQEYYEQIEQENKNETKMLEDLQLFIKQENYDGISKYFEQFKKFKQQIDNNKPASIFKELNRQLNELKQLDFSDLLDDEIAKKNKAKIKEHLTQAKLLFDAQKFNEALQILESSLEINNECVDALLLKSQTLIQLEMFDDAINYCNQIIKLNKQNFEVYVLKSIALLFIQKFNDAVDELKNVHLIQSFRFYYTILNLFQELEGFSLVVKTLTQSPTFNLKKQLQTLITNQQIPSQMVRQQLTIIIEIIKLANQNEIQKALFSFNQNFQVIGDYQQLQEVDLRPNIDPKQWQEIVEYLDQKCKKQDNHNNTQQSPDQFQAQFNNFINDTPSKSAIVQQQAQIQIQNNQITLETQKDVINFLNDTVQPQDTSNSQQQSQLANKPHAKLQQQLADFYNDPHQNERNKQQQQVEQLTDSGKGSTEIQEGSSNIFNYQSYSQVGGISMSVKLDEVNRLKEVLKYIDQLIISNQNVSQYYYKKAMILIQLNQLQQALQCIDLAIRLDNNEPNYYYQKALLLISLGQLQQALSQFDNAIQRNPNCAYYYYEKGKALSRLNRQDEAEEQFQIAKSKEDN
ncbi:unnamed protein product [Paramecium pentaurelia]|uniref:Tetratricopeptide repeat protein n=1 Tax=Paramecium pentaurelia TaxID=43138 RepID=A0A8S1VHR0_9CILI|nr:unnamed protein product [Paramecium pentaurelia]